MRKDDSGVISYRCGSDALWSTCLQHENGPARLTRYHTLIEFEREVTVPAVGYRPVSESSARARLRSLSFPNGLAPADLYQTSEEAPGYFVIRLPTIFILELSLLNVDVLGREFLTNMYVLTARTNTVAATALVTAPGYPKRWSILNAWSAPAARAIALTASQHELAGRKEVPSTGELGFPKLDTAGQ
ncbi:hypothetical protein EVAR_17096_1 [Eumeta japonica]|uniref:Uncharacterized protein n=1 Tax=Eumeta variegata TaxID=151549 RepID=A0A4C1V4N5_EUMVA|nr:hypothetical protein EVAR_17096_1 [Eumeta japonica]